MLGELCGVLRNFFPQHEHGHDDGGEDIHAGTFTISGGVFPPLPFLTEGQYFRVVGSVFSDGVHMYPASGLPDETFEGAVWAMAVPEDVVRLAEEIEEYRQKYTAAPYTSESFGGYSYTRGTSPSGLPLGWMQVFAARLNRYRKV